MRTWQDGARKFKALDEGEGWPFAQIVACCVAKDNGHGKRNARDVSGKVSAREFAEVADTSAPRVLRYLDCWQRAAERGHVPDASTLKPGDDEDMTEPEMSWLMPNGSLRFGDTKSRPTGGRPRDSQPEAAATIIERRGAEAVVEAMTPAQRQEVAAAIVEKSPVRRHQRAQAEARQRIDDSGRPQSEGVVTILEDLIHSEEIERRLNAIIDGLRTGWMDKMPDDVKEEAVQLYKRWITALEWAITLTEGGTITDESLQNWLA